MVFSFAYLKGGSLGIGSLKFSYGGSFMAIGGISSDKICCAHRPFSPPYLDGAFPLEAPTLSSDVRPHHLRRGVILRQVGSMLML
jgi:hypothetical protein